MKAELRRDFLGYLALAFALVSTFSAEHSLALAAGASSWVAVAVPGALDVYVVRAYRARRDVLAAVLAMVSVNAVSYLVQSGDLLMDWRIRVAVSAIAPLVLWRVHVLRHVLAVQEHDTPEVADTEPKRPPWWRRRARRAWDAEHTGEDLELPDWVREALEQPGEFVEWAPCSLSGCVLRNGHDTLHTGCKQVHAECAGLLRCTVYAEPEAPLCSWCSHPFHDADTPCPTMGPDGYGCFCGAPEESKVHADTSHLHSVPPLEEPEKHAAPPVLHPSLEKHLGKAREVWAEHGYRGTLRAYKEHVHCNTDTARALREYLRAEHLRLTTGGTP